MIDIIPSQILVILQEYYDKKGFNLYQTNLAINLLTIKDIIRIIAIELNMPELIDLLFNFLKLFELCQQQKKDFSFPCTMMKLNTSEKSQEKK